MGNWASFLVPVFLGLLILVAVCPGAHGTSFGYLYAAGFRCAGAGSRLGEAACISDGTPSGNRSPCPTKAGFRQRFHGPAGAAARE